MAASKSQKIQAEIDKVKAKISEQQARLKELEKNKQEAENSEIVDIVRGMSISLAELPLVLQQLREGTSGQSVQKSLLSAAPALPLLGLIFPPVWIAAQEVDVALDRHGLPHICLGLAVLGIEGLFLFRELPPPLFQRVHL